MFSMVDMAKGWNPVLRKETLPQKIVTAIKDSWEPTKKSREITNTFENTIFNHWLKIAFSNGTVWC